MEIDRVVVNDFMKSNSIAILAEADNITKMFHICKGQIELESYGLFRQLILNSNTDTLIDSISGQILPQIWRQGQDVCVIGKIDENRLICAFYHSDLAAEENYFYAKEINDKLLRLFAK
ncbi:MAG: hypothetical protein K2M46_00765 [Lachnospiraceae bacterium]|nr:hypothetical protein [Lachnospiraceae bacterium]